MKFIETKSIGNGAHWDVYQIIYQEGTVLRSEVHKRPFPKANIEANIRKYTLVSRAGLPTLSYFTKIPCSPGGYIVAEDLNPPSSDGFFVSPNTARNAHSDGDEFLSIFQDLSKIDSKNMHLVELFNKMPLSDQQIDILKKTLHLKGAEKYLYENKVRKICDFQAFLEASSVEMRKAANHYIELFADAFFFRVTDSDHSISFKIADFDCIIIHDHQFTSKQVLFDANMDYFKQSLAEYLQYFVEKDHSETYRYLL